MRKKHYIKSISNYFYENANILIFDLWSSEKDTLFCLNIISKKSRVYRETEAQICVMNMFLKIY